MERKEALCLQVIGIATLGMRDAAQKHAKIACFTNAAFVAVNTEHEILRVKTRHHCQQL
jgi:hypothetical protein